jgi:lipopolysaccharide/colanic/teichoic acid biosynthesis glycosyltransferase
MYRSIKRGLDVLGAVVALIPLSVVFIPVIVILAVTGEHQVFYRQTRIGRGGREFGILKFATMLKASPNLAGGSLTVRGDPRVLPFGRFLRATKINELPQVINVLLGDMSFVGPRPQVRGDFDHYSPEVKAAVTSVRPGITGVGSVVFRDEERFLSRPGVDPHTRARLSSGTRDTCRCGRISSSSGRRHGRSSGPRPKSCSGCFRICPRVPHGGE